MTTGRINQITILNRRRSEGAPPRREADVSVTKKVGRRRIVPSRGRQTLQRSPDAARPIQLPPLSSQEEEARSRSSPVTGRYPPKLTPERLLTDSSCCQQSTDAKRCLPP